MAVVPPGAKQLELEEALRYHKAWTTQDRDRVRAALEAEYPGYRRGNVLFEDYVAEVDRPVDLYWYVPPSGGYVAGHGVDKSTYSRADMNRIFRESGVPDLTTVRIPAPRNAVYLHAGYAVLRADSENPIRLELSAARESHRGPGTAPVSIPDICPTCFLTHAGECL